MHHKSAKEQSKPSFKGAVRHRVPHMCPQGALGRHLVAFFTGKVGSIPDPRTAAWNEAYLWPADAKRGGMTYSSHRKSTCNLYKKLELRIQKIKHAARYYAARLADELGLPDEVGGCRAWESQIRAAVSMVGHGPSAGTHSGGGGGTHCVCVCGGGGCLHGSCAAPRMQSSAVGPLRPVLPAMQEIARMGFWALNVAQAVYLLTGLKSKGLAAMGIWPGVESDESTRSYWAERFLVGVPEELFKLLFPWVSNATALCHAPGMRAFPNQRGPCGPLTHA